MTDITKESIVNKAMRESGLVGQLTPNGNYKEKVLGLLELMGSTWNSSYGIPYNVTGNYEQDFLPNPSDPSGINTADYSTFVYNLVLKIGLAFPELMITPDTKKLAASLFRNTYKALGKTKEVKRMSTMPVGVGNSRIYRAYYNDVDS